jgi:hypothetical protein
MSRCRRAAGSASGAIVGGASCLRLRQLPSERSPNLFGNELPDFQRRCPSTWSLCYWITSAKRSAGRLVFALDDSSGSPLRRVLPIQDHDLCSYWSRLRPVEVVLKPPFGPRRCIAVPEVIYRFAQDGFPRWCALSPMQRLTLSAASTCIAVATPHAKSAGISFLWHSPALSPPPCFTET